MKRRELLKKPKGNQKYKIKKDNKLSIIGI